MWNDYGCKYGKYVHVGYTFTLSSETSPRDDSKSCTNSSSGLIISEDCENSMTAKDNNTSIKDEEENKNR
jgi:RNA polymerase subunit RPABC4/transcription elongation factor Spt4